LADQARLAPCQRVEGRAGSTTLARQLGARIRALRDEVGITQEQLAWQAELDKGYLSQVEAGKRLPSIPVVVALAEHLGLETADLFVLDLKNPRLRLLEAARRNDGAELKRAIKAVE
jgi:DNA-binding XRE family transcriptional regulator